MKYQIDLDEIPQPTEYILVAKPIPYGKNAYLCPKSNIEFIVKPSKKYKFYFKSSDIWLFFGADNLDEMDNILHEELICLWETYVANENVFVLSQKEKQIKQYMIDNFEVR